MDRDLPVALIHANVRYGDPERNRENLISLNRKAAEKARLIVNTEMAVTGYSFESIGALDNLAETESGPTMTAVREIARKAGVCICMGFAEMDESTGIFYNAAHVAGPDGRTVRRYRKINAEARWACPGAAVEDNTRSCSRCEYGDHMRAA